MRKTEDQIILITGATDGLGKLVATDLARSGATILVHGRDRGKCERTLADITAATGNGKLRYYLGDLSSLAEVRRLADQLTVSQFHLDVLVNNAGLGAGPDPAVRAVSTDGFELRFAINYLAPYLLTRRLLPLLQRSVTEGGEEARIVNVASVAQQAIDFNDVMLEKNYDGMRAYSQSKLALIMFTFDLAKELAGTGVAVNAVHPASLMDTRMVREWFGTPRTTVAEGAAAVERLMTSPELEGVTGEYFDQQIRARAKDQAYDEAARRNLRELSDGWVEE